MDFIAVATDKVFTKCLSVQKAIVFVNFLFSSEVDRFTKRLISPQRIRIWKNACQLREHKMRISWRNKQILGYAFTGFILPSRIFTAAFDLAAWRVFQMATHAAEVAGYKVLAYVPLFGSCHEGQRRDRPT